jgi:hypothetical protein
VPVRSIGVWTATPSHPTSPRFILIYLRSISIYVYMLYNLSR